MDQYRSSSRSSGGYGTEVDRCRRILDAVVGERGEAGVGDAHLVAIRAVGEADRAGRSIGTAEPVRDLAVRRGLAVPHEQELLPHLLLEDAPLRCEREVEVLFDVIRGLKADGIAVIYISHRLDELYAVCDRVTIMRDGMTIDERPIVGASKPQHLDDAVAALAVALSEHEIDQLEQPYQPHPVLGFA